MATLFDVDFEENDKSDLDAQTQPGDLATSAPGLAATNFKLNVTINDVNPVYGEMNTLGSTTGYARTRFYLDPNTLTMADGDEFHILYLLNSSTQTIGRVTLRYTAADGYRVRAALINDAAGWVNGTNQDITNAEHCIEYMLVRASTNTVSDGRCYLRIDGVLVDSVTGEDNYDRFDDFDAAWLGGASGIDAGTSGTFYVDEWFANDNGDVIGTDIDPVGTYTANSYVLAADADGAWKATSAAINGYTVDTTSAATINASVAAITADSVNIYTSGPPDTYDIEVTLDTSISRVIDPHFFGFNWQTYSYRDDGTANTINLNDARWPALLGHLRPGLIRYMGGDNDIEWDPTDTCVPWNPADPNYDRCVRSDHLTDIWEIFDAVGSQIYFTVNMMRDDQADWVDMMDYCVTNNIDIDFICGGNEPRAAGVGASTYVTRLEDYMDDLRGEKATLEFGAAETTRGTWLNYGSWVNTVLGNLASDGYPLAYISSHHHQLKGYQSSGPADVGHSTVENLLQWGNGVRGLEWWGTYADSICTKRDSYHPDAKVILGEYGASLDLGGYNSAETRLVWKSVATALWMCDVLGRVARNGADGALYWFLSQPDTSDATAGTFMIFDNEWTFPLRPSFYAYLMFGQWWGDRWITAVSSTSEDKLSVTASVSDDGNVYCMLINKTGDEDLDVEVTISSGGSLYYAIYGTQAGTVTLLEWITPPPAGLYLPGSPTVTGPLDWTALTTVPSYQSE
jgi:hypothetical protein